MSREPAEEFQGFLVLKPSELRYLREVLATVQERTSFPARGLDDLVERVDRAVDRLNRKEAKAKKK